MVKGYRAIWDVDVFRGQGPKQKRYSDAIQVRTLGMQVNGDGFGTPIPTPPDPTGLEFPREAYPCVFFPPYPLHLTRVPVGLVGNGYPLPSGV